MSNLEKSLFQLKVPLSLSFTPPTPAHTLPQFTAKSLQRQSKKANKDETMEKNKLKAALQKGNTDIAKIYAQNAIRKKTEGLNLLRLASRIDAVASRVETAVTMRTVTNSMGQVVKGMDRAMESMNLEKISMVMDKFESQFSDLDVQTSYMESTMSDTTALTTPQDQVDSLINQVADEAGLEIQHGLGDVKVPAQQVEVVEKEGAVRNEEDGKLADRLRALRPAV
ncbi:charged multivesicular body protein 1, partial [Tremellales sp. Uapishka_1]